MKPIENVEEAVRRKLRFTAASTLRDRWRKEVLQAREEPTKTRPALREPILRSAIMRNSYVRLALAAGVILAVVLGLSEFLGTGGKSGVVWADVARKVEASRRVVFRSRETDSGPHAVKADYVMNYLSRTRSRADSYREGQIFQTIYDDYSTKTIVLVRHDHKAYLNVTDQQMGQVEDRTDPKKWVQRFLACEHRGLGQKTIDGVLCDGIETMDPAFAGAGDPIDSLTAQIWVSVETGYPILMHGEMVRNKGEIRITITEDEFQWDKELDESLFTPDIPQGYTEIEPP